MIFIVDTNILFSGLLRDSTTRELLIDCPFILYVPETIITEIRKYEEEIIRRSGLATDDFELLLSLLIKNIIVVEKEKYEDKMKDASELIGHADKDDIPFLALALKVPNNGIWTENIKHFEKQNLIKVWTTKDILDVLDKT